LFLPGSAAGPKTMQMVPRESGLKAAVLAPSHALLTVPHKNTQERAVALACSGKGSRD
jgi:hypothetical protein